MLTLRATPTSGSGARWVSGAPQMRLAQAGSEVEAAVKTAAEDLALHADHLAEDLALARDSERVREIQVIGEALSQEQVLGVIAKTANRLAEMALTMMLPPLSPYVTPETAGIVASAEERLRGIASGAAVELGELDKELSWKAEDYMEAHAGAAAETMHAAERMVVIEENGEIGIYELNEVNGGGLSLFSIVGIAAVVALMVAAA